ncbi:hypothetical protein JW823_07690 [bacterium]|nr:hypothetical protein [candidate division CSSED10-310 bacterium]
MNQEKQTIIDTMVRNALTDEKLTCASALKIAAELKVSPRVIGEAANRLKIKIASCQLGCFK